MREKGFFLKKNLVNSKKSRTFARFFRAVCAYKSRNNINY